MGTEMMKCSERNRFALLLVEASSYTKAAWELYQAKRSLKF